MVPGWFSWFQVGFSWFQVGFSWFFTVPGWLFMVFLKNLPALTVSWPDNPVYVRGPEGGIGPSYKIDSF